jgi:hypothetical protein
MPGIASFEAFFSLGLMIVADARESNMTGIHHFDAPSSPAFPSAEGGMSQHQIEIVVRGASASRGRPRVRGRPRFP